MLFHEIYGSYYQAAALILREAVKDSVSDERIAEVIQKEAFEESLPIIKDKLTSSVWKLLHKDNDGRYRTQLDHYPEQPLTFLQKRWLKALLSDPRITLFFDDVQAAGKGLEDVEPLFDPEMFVFYDRNTDSDPYEEADYRAYFKLILKAIEDKKILDICFKTGKGIEKKITVLPDHLEYSEKDDRFRLIASNTKNNFTVNLSSILSCKLSDEKMDAAPITQERKELVFTLEDERNALDRALREFSYFEKKVKQLNGKEYEISLKYDPGDETEIVIRILSFGPVIHVTEPAEVIEKLRDRIHKQKNIIPLD